MKDFDYLGEGEVYLDSACQSLRPRPVIGVLTEYYTKFNSCGERVKYPWGIETDRRVEATRKKIIKYLRLKARDYFVSFTLNTTYGINLVLSQLDYSKFSRIITTDIEHNSPFLATLSYSKKFDLPREIITRNPDGSVPLDSDFSKAIVVLNCASNFDGRKLLNIKDLISRVHKAGGIVLIDAAQAMAHSPEILYKQEPDAIFFSAHKLYAPSLGAMIIKRELLSKIKTSFIGGGMVDDVTENSYLLSAENPEHIYTKFESGLQAWGEIIALGEALDWISNLSKAEHKNLENNYNRLYEFLKDSSKITLVNEEANPTMSFYVDGLDSHLLGAALGDEKIMARTGYFCAHYYLDKVRKFPPLIRFSLGYHNREEDIDKVIEKMEKIA